jgi:hypothetical protein
LTRRTPHGNVRGYSFEEVVAMMSARSLPWLVALSSLGLSTAARAEPTQYPGILYVPLEDVELLAASDPQCAGVDVHSGKSCGGADRASTVAPYDDAEGLGSDLAEALADFDVTVTHTRPPKYVPFLMLLASDVEASDSASFTCTAGGIDCAAQSRRRIATTSGGSLNCTNPDPLQAALYAFGRMSGLEGVENPDDPMGYPPSYTPAVTAFDDSCASIVQQQGFDVRGNPVLLPLECEETDHTGCDPGMQNSVADLTATYGAAAFDPDVDPPVIAIVSPEDGQVFVQGDDVVIDGTVEDDDAFVGAMWTVRGEGLVELLDVDTYEYCTNQACIPGEGRLRGVTSRSTGWDEPDAAKATDSSFEVPTIRGLPVGEYTVTFEASDMHGNVADAISITFTVEEPPPSDDTGAGSGAGDDAPPADDGTPADGGSSSTTGGGESSTAADGSGSGTGDASATGDGGGCGCSSEPDREGRAFFWLGISGLAVARRRDRAARRTVRRCGNG